MKKEYFEEKFSKLEDKLSYIGKRLNHVEDSVNLGTFDASVLTLLIFVVGLGVSLISLGIPTVIKNNPPIFVGLIYLLVLVVPILVGIYGYLLSIFEKNNRFTRKIITLTILQGLVSFVVGVWFLLFIFWLYETKLGIGKVSPLAVYISMGALFVLVIIYTIFGIYPRISAYFKSNFKYIVRKRLQEIKKDKPT